MDELKRDPIWRQAALDAQTEFNYGDIIPMAWLKKHLEISEPEGLMSPEKYQDMAFELLSKVDGFREEMLCGYKQMTVNIRGVGYQIIRPPHQTDAAMKKFQREFRRAWHQAMANLVHINESMLTLEDARRNAEARAKLAWFKKDGLKQIAKSEESN